MPRRCSAFISRRACWVSRTRWVIARCCARAKLAIGQAAVRRSSSNWFAHLQHLSLASPVPVHAPNHCALAPALPGGPAPLPTAAQPPAGEYPCGRFMPLRRGQRFTFGLAGVLAGRFTHGAQAFQRFTHTARYVASRPQPPVPWQTGSRRGKQPVLLAQATNCNWVASMPPTPRFCRAAPSAASARPRTQCTVVSSSARRDCSVARFLVSMPAAATLSARRASDW